MATLDPDLLARLKQRDPDALRSVAEQNARPLFKAALAMGCEATEADDLVQDVFVTFLGSLDRFEGRSQLTTWLIGILHFKVQERRRSRAKADEAIDETFESQFDARGHWISMPPDPQKALQGARLREALRGCLDALPPTQRAVFQLRIVEERSAIDAGNVLGQSVTHVGVLLHRARARLRECLEAKGMAGAL